ncbi:MAG: hypothetical protein WCJ09_22560 [Planctomycetota bacterium]
MTALLIAMLLLASAIFLSRTESEQRGENSPATVVGAVNESTFNKDCGAIIIPRGGAEAKAEFQLPFVGDVAVPRVISRSCTCIDVSVEPIAGTWDNGAAVTINGKWSSIRSHQRLHATIARSIGHGKIEEHTVSICGDCYPAIEAIPTRVELGPVDRRGVPSAQFIVRQFGHSKDTARRQINLGTTQSEIHFTSKSQVVELMAEKLYRIDTTVTVEYRGTGAGDNESGSISATDGENSIAIPVTWRQINRIRITPRAIIVKDSAKTQTVQLKGPPLFRVVSVRLPSGVRLGATELDVQERDECEYELLLNPIEFVWQTSEIVFELESSGFEGRRQVVVPIARL